MHLSMILNVHVELTTTVHRGVLSSATGMNRIRVHKSQDSSPYLGDSSLKCMGSSH